jgi:hypothetical protein
MFAVVSVFSNVLIIKSFLSLGMFFSSKKSSIFLMTIFPSVLFPVSLEDFKSDFSSGGTLPEIPIVEIMEADTR